MTIKTIAIEIVRRVIVTSRYGGREPYEARHSILRRGTPRWQTLIRRSLLSTRAATSAALSAVFFSQPACAAVARPFALGRRCQPNSVGRSCSCLPSRRIRLSCSAFTSYLLLPTVQGIADTYSEWRGGQTLITGNLPFQRVCHRDHVGDVTAQDVAGTGLHIVPVLEHLHHQRFRYLQPRFSMYKQVAEPV
ncbi:hypothetical protein LMG22037_04117 [Paraburkholderia phenoliruptrix]|uniref:Uncharacterized protein n=1 Tax=Paraburkholderia phenoliruptrix TaxID=252970 RepID=A0A6J5BMC0_9BURK|nr:hypothetical protein LMG22037_04117 [Paraburkholderia phenoliruptrix]